LAAINLFVVVLEMYSMSMNIYFHPFHVTPNHAHLKGNFIFHWLVLATIRVLPNLKCPALSVPEIGGWSQI